MLSRRNILGVAGTALVASSASSRAQPAPSASTNFDPVAAWGFTPPVMEPSGFVEQATGTKPPRQNEIQQSFQIHNAAPRGQPPLSVARYFEALTQTNEDGDPYNYEWPVKGRANPVIVTFFASTFTTPSGDQTAWCAAFVNYCLMLARRPMTGSALSGSFRSHSAFPPTNDPQPGDVVVLRNRDSSGDLGHGHVGFFLSRTSSEVTLLGGNQRGTTGSTGAVTQATFPTEGGSLALLGYRKVSMS